MAMNPIDKAMTKGSFAADAPSAAAEKQAPVRTRAAAIGTELAVLLRIQYAEVRETWMWVIVLASVFPFTTLLFMKFFLHSPSPDDVMRIVSGNIIFPIIIMGINGLGNHIAWSRHQGHFTYYASLPISKINFLFSFMIRGFLMTFPSVVIMTIVGQTVFHVHVHLSFALVPMVLLSVTGSAGLGTLIGFLSPNQDLANMLTNLLMVFLNFLTPVMIDIHQLPAALQAISYAFPTTYAADGLSLLFRGSWTYRVSLDLLALAGFTLATLWVVAAKMDWRLEK